MGQKSEKYATATTSYRPLTAGHAQGTLLKVDVVGREIVVLSPRGPTVFDVPCECRILLRGEPIKLRLIQPRDRVCIAFDDRQGRFVAHMLEVQSDMTLDPIELPV